MAQQVIWLFGRGLSIGCGLTWDVPKEWAALPRSETIANICSTLRAEMDSIRVDQQHSRVTKVLAQRTNAGWGNFFSPQIGIFAATRDALLHPR